MLGILRLENLLLRSSQDRINDGTICFFSVKSYGVLRSPEFLLLSAGEIYM